MDKILPPIDQDFSSAFRQRSILLIDDSPDLLMVQKILLELEGFAVYTANSGLEAFRFFAENQKIDLILLDVTMQDMTGPDFLDLLSERHPEVVSKVPVVFLTGLDSVPLKQAAGFIRKARGVPEFLDAVNRFLALGQLSPYKH